MDIMLSEMLKFGAMLKLPYGNFENLTASPAVVFTVSARYFQVESALL